MMKGHAKIELTNVHTGEKEVYEHDNLVTNIVANQIAELGKYVGYTDINSQYLPLYQKAMGGILLFPETLEENADNYFLSPTRAITGYASQNTTLSKDNKLGLLNTEESGLSSDGKSYKFSWTFDTSKANGTISSLALTSGKCGYNPYGLYADSSTSLYDWRTIDLSLGNTDFKYVVDYDFDTHIATCAYLTSTTEVYIAQYRIPLDEIRLNTTLLTPELISKNTVALGVSFTSVDGVIVKSENYFYVLYAANSAGSGNPLYACRLKNNNGTWQYDSDFGYKQIPRIIYTETTTNDAGDEIFKDVYTSGSISKFNLTAKAISDKYIVVTPTNSSYKHLYVVNMETGNLVNYIDTTQTFQYSSVLCTKNDNGTEKTYLINSKFMVDITNVYDLQIVYRNNTSEDAPVIYPTTNDNYHPSNESIDNNNVLCCFTTKARIAIGGFQEYLATINNLDTPIEKSSAQSMKITYTLTEA